MLIGSSVPGEDEYGSDRDVLLATTRATAACYGQGTYQDERAYSKNARPAANTSSYYIVNRIFIKNENV